MDSYTQQLFPETLQWKEKQELINELYGEMKSFVNDTTPVIVKYNKFNFSEMNLLGLFNRIFKKKKIKKQLTLQRAIKQNETRNYLDSNFVLINNSVDGFVFKNKNQITEWGKSLNFSPFVPNPAVFSNELCIKDNNIFILMVSGYSGIPCMSFYIFKESGNIWELQTSSQVILKGKLKIRVDNEQEKIVFETEARKIGELLF